MALELKTRLKRAHGWQRIWFLVSVLGVLYGIFIFPFVTDTHIREAESQHGFAIKNEMENPICQVYMTAPLNTLIQQPYGNPCHHLYMHRSHSSEKGQQPLTKEGFAAEVQRELWLRLSLGALFGCIGALLISALVYFVGFLLAWVAAGFRTKAN